MATSLDAADRASLRAALRSARGWYSADRAAQLSGIPERTLYDWAQNQVLVPDYAGDHPMGWSYRDLVFARLCLGLRAMNMPRADVARYVHKVRAAMELADDATTTDVRADGRLLVIGDATFDEETGVGFFEGLVEYAVRFDLSAPLGEIGTTAAHGPNLLYPSPHTAISPWIQGGEPCVRETRVPTATLYVLHTERALTVDKIVRLYPDLTPDEVEDAVKMETTLRTGLVAA